MISASWHVHYDGEPQVRGHICTIHRQVGMALSCPDAGPDGDCPHVQVRRCDCDDRQPCDACRE